MSRRDGHEWYHIPRDEYIKCDMFACEQEARWEQIFISCDKSSYSGVVYCDNHSVEEGNLLVQDEETDCQEDKYETLVRAAIEAIEHVAQANWGGREEAAKQYLYQVAEIGSNGLSLNEIQKKINES